MNILTIRALRSLAVTIGPLAMVLGLCSCNTLPSMRPGGFSTVVIDAGHGGQDSGARSRSGSTEKAATLDTALRLRPLLQRAGFQTVMTRTDDTFVELDNRVALANRYPNAVLVSIHYNSSPSSAPTGGQTFYWWSKSYGLGARVERHLVARTGLANKGTTRRVLRMTHNPQVPAILCECGFLSNPGEANRIASADFRQNVARGIAEGIIEQHNSGDAGLGPLPPEPPPVPYEHGPAHHDYEYH